MRLENLMIGIAIFIVVITLGLNMYITQNNNYDIDGDSTLFDSIANATEGFDTQVEGLQEGTQLDPVSDEDTEASLYKENIPTIRSIFTSVPIVGRVLNVVVTEMGLLPDFVKQAFVFILIILAGVFVVYMIARFKPPNN